MKNTKYLAMLIAVLGLVVLVIGVAYVGLGIQKNNLITDTLRAQKITLGLTTDEVAAGKLVDDAQTAQVAAETLNTHLSKIAPTYNDLMAANSTGKFDPTKATNVTYGQGLTMETSFNLAVLSFGVIQETIVTGITLIIIGLVIGLSGLALASLARKLS